MTRGGARTLQLLATGNLRGAGLDSLWSIVDVITIALVEWVKKRQISVMGSIFSATGLGTIFPLNPSESCHSLAGPGSAILWSGSSGDRPWSRAATFLRDSSGFTFGLLQVLLRLTVLSANPASPYPGLTRAPPNRLRLDAGPTPLGHLAITPAAPISPTFLNGERIMSNDCARQVRARRRSRQNGLVKAAFDKAGESPASPGAVRKQLPPAWLGPGNFPAKIMGAAWADRQNRQDQPTPSEY